MSLIPETVLTHLGQIFLLTSCIKGLEATQMLLCESVLIQEETATLFQSDVNDLCV